MALFAARFSPRDSLKDPTSNLKGNYTREEDGIRKYKMNIMNTCYATLLPKVVLFFYDLDKIRSWALNTLLNDIGEQLVVSERTIRARAKTFGNTSNNIFIQTIFQGLYA